MSDLSAIGSGSDLILLEQVIDMSGSDGPSVDDD